MLSILVSLLWISLLLLRLIWQLSEASLGWLACGLSTKPAKSCRRLHHSSKALCLHLHLWRRLDCICLILPRLSGLFRLLPSLAFWLSFLECLTSCCLIWLWKPTEWLMALCVGWYYARVGRLLRLTKDWLPWALSRKCVWGTCHHCRRKWSLILLNFLLFRLSGLLSLSLLHYAKSLCLLHTWCLLSHLRILGVLGLLSLWLLLLWLRQALAL